MNLKKEILKYKWPYRIKVFRTMLIKDAPIDVLNDLQKIYPFFLQVYGHKNYNEVKRLFEGRCIKNGKKKDWEIYHLLDNVQSWIENGSPEDIDNFF